MMNRRRLLFGAAAALSAPMILRKAEAAQSITVRDGGGIYVSAFGEAFYKPFEQATGVKVIPAAARLEPVAELKAMVDSATYTWDVALLSMSAQNLLVEGNYLAPLMLEGTAFDEIPPEYRRPHFCGTDVYSEVLVYRTDRMKRAPGSWADFWNVEGFPGRRSLRSSPFDTIEIALMADGVPIPKVYPCDFERAYKSLDRIKPHVAVWWKQVAQSAQLLTSGEVDMLQMYNGSAQKIIDSGVPAKIVWNESIAGVEGFGILRGTPRLELARKFIAFCAQAKQQAILAKYMTAGPVNPNAYKYIDPARAELMTTNPAHRPITLMIDSKFWAANQSKALERFDEWMLK